ncbi:MAG TPA: hypothetical protein VJ978_12390 [Nitriliruptoraceae bacterium]|nr:hypothetical protein [Nitriliruptoraceae bacterium]
MADNEHVESDAAGNGAAWPTKVAGAVTILVGLVNALVAVAATSTSGLEMRPTTAALLVVAGLVTMWLGWRIWGGAVWALHTALVGFSLLLAAQVLVSEPDSAEQGTSVVVLVVLVAVLLVAAGLRRRRRHQRRDPGPN